MATALPVLQYTWQDYLFWLLGLGMTKVQDLKQRNEECVFAMRTAVFKEHLAYHDDVILRSLSKMQTT